MKTDNMKKIKELIKSIYDQNYGPTVMLPIKTMQMFDMIMNDQIKNDFMIVVNGSRHSSWPDVIQAAGGGNFEDVEKVMAFFKDAGCPVMATFVNGIETVYHLPMTIPEQLNYFGISTQDHS